MKDRFNKDMREKVRVRSGAAARFRKYKTWCSTTQPRSSSVEVAPHLPATEQTQSQSSTSDGATMQASQAEEEVAGPSGFPLSQASAAAFPGSSCQRQRAWERSGIPEFMQLSSIFQDGIRFIADRVKSGFKEVNKCLDRLEADLERPAQHFFSAIEWSMSENLTPQLQLNLMQACQVAYSHALQQQSQQQSQTYNQQATGY
ncbi:uncharacterized protein [Dendrobates tinctorius]|uniref:uncharacterized protein n=1 Tax=Dendrobates tinctorius TaxID=92724 RepID=UPI003CC96F49